MPCSSAAGIVRADFAADAVLERRDDLAARGVVFRVGGEHQQQVERQADRIALNLHVAFLHDVEQPDLDLAGQVGQFVDGEDAAVGARQQAVVHGQFVGDVLPAARRLDRVDIADHVGDGDVGRGQLLDVAMIAVEPGDGGLVALLRRSGRGSGGRSAGTGCRGSRSLRHRAHTRRAAGEHADEPRLGLPAQSEQNEVVPRKHGVDHLRNHRVFVADDAGEQCPRGAACLQIRLARSSSLTDRLASRASEKVLSRSAPRVRGSF